MLLLFLVLVVVVVVVIVAAAVVMRKFVGGDCLAFLSTFFHIKCWLAVSVSGEVLGIIMW